MNEKIQFSFLCFQNQETLSGSELLLGPDPLEGVLVLILSHELTIVPGVFSHAVQDHDMSVQKDGYQSL